MSLVKQTGRHLTGAVDNRIRASMIVAYYGDTAVLKNEICMDMLFPGTPKYQSPTIRDIVVMNLTITHGYTHSYIIVFSRLSYSVPILGIRGRVQN